MITVLLACPDADFALTFEEFAAESSAFRVARVVHDGEGLMASLEQPDLDVICIHEGLGPLPALEIARAASTQVPDVALVLLAETISADTLRSALHAGFRGVAQLPLSLEDLSGTVTTAGQWAQSVRSRLAGEVSDGEGGVVYALAGSKGGVGTTTLAVQLATQIARDQTRQVCLVDLDLQTGDIGTMMRIYDGNVASELDLDGHRQRRSIIDLNDVGYELTGRQLDESMFTHSSGVRVLLSPPEGEDGEDITSTSMKQIIAGLRRRFSLVLIDVGSVMTEAASVAVELADQVLLVVTPDTPSLRGANRMLALWERLGWRQERILTVINRASRELDVQPDSVRRFISGTPVAGTTVPSDFLRMEDAVNTGTPERLEGPVADSVRRLAVELGLLSQRRSRSRLRFRADSGQVSVETLGVLPFVLLTVLLLVQMLLAGYTIVLSGQAAQEGARVLAVSSHRFDAPLEAEVVDAVTQDLPSGWRDDAQIRLDRSTSEVSVELAIPLLLPGLSTPVRFTSTHGARSEGREIICPGAAAGLGAGSGGRGCR